MNCETCLNYREESERTERKFPDGLEIDGNTGAMVARLMRSSELFGLMLNQFKKVIIYDKPLDGIQDEVMSLSEELAFVMGADDAFELLALDQKRAETLHAVLGLVTEMAEITPLLMKYILGIDEECDEAHLNEEIGDFFFYFAILERLFGLDVGEIKQRNTAKLKVRYPDKFSSESALNRDLEAEQEALNGC
jgi:NTP pyrophosphatase (non-canonical NTP hydrolase)